ncbi:hypothetical protein ACFPRA_01325 [Sporosarcina soli]|uniref:Uncharacterized protein n=1 Tax=Sporosarcina soli TaxID=334736 RepID=A0ABW0TG10_9BACL
MYNDPPKDYSTEKVTLANVYDPVKYMLKNLQRRTSLSIDNKISKNNKKEGGTLHRNGHFLKKVEGDRFYDYLLYYNAKNLLSHFVTIHKMTGKTEQWTLHFAPNGHLLRYDYELTNEGIEEQHDDSEALYDGWGESVDYYL